MATDHIGVGTTLTLSNDTIPVNKDSIENATHTLDELTVESERVLILKNGLLLIPSRRDKRFASGGIDVLVNMNIPELVINPITQEVKTSGGDGVAMFIDFRPATSQMLSDMRTQDVERIEFLRAPEDPRFQGVPVAVNFIMKQYSYGGYTKLNETERFCLTPYLGIYNIYSKFTYRRMTFDISGSTEYRNFRDNINLKEYTRYTFGQMEVERNSIGDKCKTDVIIPKVTARAIYQTANIVLSNSLGFNYAQVDPDRSETDVTYSSLFESGRSIQEKKKEKKAVVWNGNYFFMLSEKSSLAFNGDFTWTHNTDNTSYTLTGYPPIRTDISETINDFNGSLTYGLDLGTQSLNFQVSGGRNRSRLNYLSATATPLLYINSYGLARVQGNFSIRKFSIRPSVGVSLLAKKINDRSYSRYYPKAFIPIYLPLSSKDALNGSFEFAIGGPEASQLSPVLVRVNEIYAIRGNDKLRNYLFYNSMLGYFRSFAPWLRTRLDVTFNHNSNIIVPVYTEEEGSDGYPLMVRDVRNNGSRSFVNIMLGVSGEYFNRRLYLNLQGGAKYFARRGSIRRDEWTPDFNMNASFFVGDFKLSAYYRPTLWWYNVWDDVKSVDYFYVSAAWSWRDLFIDCRWSNPFRKSNSYGITVTNAPNYKNLVRSYDPAYHQLISLNLTYSFSYGKKIRHDNEVTGLKGAESIILK